MKLNNFCILLRVKYEWSVFVFQGPSDYFRIINKRELFSFRVFKHKLCQPSTSLFLCKWGTDIRHLFSSLESEVWSWVSKLGLPCIFHATSFHAWGSYQQRAGEWWCAWICRASGQVTSASPCWNLWPLSSPAGRAKSEAWPQAPPTPCVKSCYSTSHTVLPLMFVLVSDKTDNALDPNTPFSLSLYSNIYLAWTRSLMSEKWMNTLMNEGMKEWILGLDVWF